MNSTTPENEKRRLKVLWQYEVLDTVPEEVFDELAELAASICQTPVAMISLVDENRQWFKARIGTELEETPRSVSFCTHAIQQPGLFIVPDAFLDRRFAENPLVRSEPHVRFYAGAPLISPEGLALGTLCVVDKVPRELRPDQQQALLVLARHVVSQLELRRRSRALLEAQHQGQDAVRELKEVRAELAQARRELAGKKRRRQPSARSKTKRTRRSR